MLSGDEERVSNRLWGVRIGAIAVVVAVLVVFVFYRMILSNTRDVADRMIAEASRAFERVEPLTSEDAAALRTYKNEEHVERAKELGVEPLEARDEVVELVRETDVVVLQDNPYFVVDEMDYSVPYVTESTANLLTLIGARFQEALRERGLPPYRFVVTSATRTKEDQEALGQVNVNAADTSSHEFGTTVDLHYREFSYAPMQADVPSGFWISERRLQNQLERAYDEITEERQVALKAILGRVLREMQREGEVLVIYERRQPVYHITLGETITASEVAQAVGDEEDTDLLIEGQDASALP